MKIITKKMPNNFNLFLCGDLHIGNLLHYRKGLDKFLNMVESEWEGVSSKHNYVIDHGDVIEAITIDDKRFDPLTCTEPIPMEQAKDTVKIYSPIKNKIITILDGNHPWKLSKFGNLTQYICNNLGVEYGTWSSKIVFNDNKGDLIFKSFHTHGSRGINSSCDDIKRRKVNMELSLKRNLRDLDGSSALMSCGHTHRLIVCKPESELYITNDGEEIKQAYTLPQYLNKEFANASSNKKIDREIYKRDYIHPDSRWFVNTGSFLKTFELGVSSYSERANYAPLELGFAIAEVRDKMIKKVVPIYLCD